MSTVETGDRLEEALERLFRAEIENDRFFARKTCCKLYRRKGYYSQDRKATIIFDLSIEISLPGAKDFSVLILIECKNYTHPVPVDDAEEFFAKVQQVGAANTKAILASTAAFQSGTREFAKSKKMGLLRFFNAKHFKWELHRSPSASARDVSPETTYVTRGLSQPDFLSEVFDLFLQTPTRVTNSLSDLLDDIIATTTLSMAEVRKISNPTNRQSTLAPFKEKANLEALADETLEAISYDSGPVSLDAICAREAQRSGLVVETTAPPPEVNPAQLPLGRIQFVPLRIQVFTYPQRHPGRDRFTLAHELAHYILGHGNYIRREYCDQSDFVLHRRRNYDATNIARLEYQANYFAASLLMPRKNFITDVWRLLDALDIPDRGFGPLYVDNQRCNLNNYSAVTSDLMSRYMVSRTSTAIRLESLGILHDVRKTRHPARVLAGRPSLLEGGSAPTPPEDEIGAI